MRPFLLLLALAVSASAQPLTVTPEPFDASGTAPLVIRNGTAAPVRLDSLNFSRSERFSNRGWQILYLTTLAGGPDQGTVFCLIDLATRGAAAAVAPRACRDNSGLFGRTFQPRDSLTAYRVSVECNACFAPLAENDTLLVYTNGSRSPLRVRIRNGRGTASEPVPATRPAALSVSPNPARSHVEIVAPGVATVVVTDALGRLVATVRMAGTALLDISGWAPGVYAARVTGGAPASTRFVVAR